MKWFDREENLKDGDIVLVTDQGTPKEAGKLEELLVYIRMVIGW